MSYGRGFGFRGASPGWPYTGRGRGGLPRCWSPEVNQGYAPPAYGGYSGWGPAPYPPQAAPEQELGFLREEADALRRRLEEIDARITELESSQ